MGHCFVGLNVLFFFVLIGVVGPFFVGDPTDFVAVPLEPPSADHWLGTTGQGQDVLAQTVVGTRTSLLLGLLVGASVVLIGGLIGTTAAWGTNLYWATNDAALLTCD